MHIFYNSKSNNINKTIHYPININNKNFNNFTKKYTKKTNFKIPPSLTKTTIKQYNY